MLTNWEVRFPLFWKLGMVLFYDGGQISDSFQTVQWKDLQWNSGVGITINLPFAPIRVDYGESIENPNLNKIHFGILYSF